MTDPKRWHVITDGGEPLLCQGTSVVVGFGSRFTGSHDATAMARELNAYAEARDLARDRLGEVCARVASASTVLELMGHDPDAGDRVVTTTTYQATDLAERLGTHNLPAAEVRLVFAKLDDYGLGRLVPGLISEADGFTMPAIVLDAWHRLRGRQ